MVTAAPTAAERTEQIRAATSSREFSALREALVAETRPLTVIGVAETSDSLGIAITHVVFGTDQPTGRQATIYCVMRGPAMTHAHAEVTHRHDQDKRWELHAEDGKVQAQSVSVAE